ncbi:cytochrome P450 family protein [Nocardia callitridis]|uniref:Cytochrome P450 n=1 Tax=Nocardia callitridis TaxID=648753 RepID=A0ABP9KC24_9NOCA
MNVLPEDFFRDPHVFYEQVRAEGPIHRIQLRNGLRAWLVVDYDIAREVLRHPDIRKDPNSVEGRQARVNDAGGSGLTSSNERLRHHLLTSDQPMHTRLRKLVTPAFSPARMTALIPRIEQIADELLDDVDRAGGPVDLLAAYAFPLPLTVICELLGVPIADREQFREWSSTVVDASMSTPEQQKAAGDAVVEYFDELIERKRREEPGEDLLSYLLSVSDDGDQLSVDELISMAQLILIAGHETTVNLIGNTVLALLTDPQRYRALREDPDAVAPLIEEMLRFNGPVNTATLRHTAKEVTLGGVRIPASELVLVSVAAANRDPRHFDDPDSFDPARGAGSHLAFGYGIHFCLGAALARWEAKIAITKLVSRYPELSLAVDNADLGWRESILIRGLLDLPVDPAGAVAMR